MKNRFSDYINNKKLAKLVSYANEYVGGDADRTFRGIEILTNGSPVAVIIFVSGYLVKIELLDSSRNISTLTAVWDASARKMLIGDIHTKHINRGIASIAVRNLLDISFELNCSIVHGNFTCEDRKNFNRLEHFYRKNGFDVRFNHNQTEGEVCFDLGNKILHGIGSIPPPRFDENLVEIIWSYDKKMFAQIVSRDMHSFQYKISRLFGELLWNNEYIYYWAPYGDKTLSIYDSPLKAREEIERIFSED